MRFALPFSHGDYQRCFAESSKPTLGRQGERSVRTAVVYCLFYAATAPNGGFGEPQRSTWPLREFPLRAESESESESVPGASARVPPAATPKIRFKFILRHAAAQNFEGAERL